jgi:hypothetical protein
LDGLPGVEVVWKKPVPLATIREAYSELLSFMKVHDLSYLLLDLLDRGPASFSDEKGMSQIFFISSGKNSRCSIRHSSFSYLLSEFKKGEH